MRVTAAYRLRRGLRRIIGRQRRLFRARRHGDTFLECHLHRATHNLSSLHFNHTLRTTLARIDYAARAAEMR